MKSDLATHDAKLAGSKRATGKHRSHRLAFHENPIVSKDAYQLLVFDAPKQAKLAELVRAKGDKVRKRFEKSCSDVPEEC